MIPGLAVVVFFAVQRLSELALNRINAARLLARGGVKVREPWYPTVIALHLAWLGGLGWLAWSRPMPLWWLAVFALLQAGRMWTVTSLGERWTTQIIVAPGEARVRSGPYRWFPHPNYLVVALEVALVPLALGLPWFAAGFSAANLPLLWLRARTEDRALAAAELAPDEDVPIPKFGEKRPVSPSGRSEIPLP